MNIHTVALLYGNGFALHRSWVRVLDGHHWASYLHLCASVTKQYNYLVLATGVISLAGKVTAGIV